MKDAHPREATTPAAEPAGPTRRMKPWETILVFGILLFVLQGVAAFLVEEYSGGCMFIIPAYFYALVVILPVLLVRRFGVAAAIYAPAAILGLPMLYYFEWITERHYVGVWAPFVWSLLFVAYGLSADLAYRLLPATVSERWRAILSGAVLGGVTFGLTLLGLTTLYVPSAREGHLLFFTNGIYFSLPWMVITSAFGGYTAYAISRNV